MLLIPSSSNPQLRLREGGAEHLYLLGIEHRSKALAAFYSGKKQLHSTFAKGIEPRLHTGATATDLGRDLIDAEFIFQAEFND